LREHVLVQIDHRGGAVATRRRTWLGGFVGAAVEIRPQLSLACSLH
jgi:hypothetical protein